MPNVIPNPELDATIQQMFDDNKVSDLERFMDKRKGLNECNVRMLYMFHIIQTGGIFTSSYGASLNNTNIIWLGIILNMIASVIQIFEKINDGQLKRLLKDIKNIKDDKYIDESAFINLNENINSSPKNNDNKHNSAKETRNIGIEMLTTLVAESNTTEHSV